MLSYSVDYFIMENPIQSQPSNDKYKLFLPISIIVAAIIISGAVLYGKTTSPKTAGVPSVQNNNNAPVQPSGPVNVSVDDDPMLGNPKAKVTIVEFSDFQCPFCRTFWSGAFQQIKTEYIDTGKVRFVYRDFPLSFHPAAQPAAEAAQCANDQGKFWEMHDKLFQEQEKKGTGTIQFSETDIQKWASQIPGLDVNKLNECISSNKYKSEVEKDLKDGSAYGVSGTPTLFINGRPIVGAQPFSAFKAEIDALLK